jgi:uracil-DNA glycosylase family 4
MGNTAARTVFGATVKITAIRGKPMATDEEFEWGHRIWVPTFHPAAALRNPSLTAVIEEDLTLAKSLLE